MIPEASASTSVGNGPATEDVARGAGGVILNSTSLEDVPLSEHSDNRAQSVLSLHTEEEVDTPTPTPKSESPICHAELNSEQEQEILRNSKERINKMEKERDYLLRMKDAFKSKVNSLTKYVDMADLGETLEELEKKSSIEKVKETTEKLNSTVQKLQDFLKFQEVLEEKLDSGLLLSDQEDINGLDSKQKKINDLACKRDKNSNQSDQQKLCQNNDVNEVQPAAWQPEVLKVKLDRNPKQANILSMNDLKSKSFVREVPISLKPEAQRPTINDTTFNLHEKLNKISAAMYNQADNISQARIDIELLQQEVAKRQRELNEAVKDSETALLNRSLRPTPTATPTPVEIENKTETVPDCLLKPFRPLSPLTINLSKKYSDILGKTTDNKELIRQYDEQALKYNQMTKKLKGLLKATKNGQPNNESAYESISDTDMEIEEFQNLTMPQNVYSVPPPNSTATNNNNNNNNSGLVNSVLSSASEIPGACSTPVQQRTAVDELNRVNPVFCTRCTPLSAENATTVVPHPFSANMQEMLTCSLVQCQQIVWQQQKELEASRNTIRMLHEQVNNLTQKNVEATQAPTVSAPQQQQPVRTDVPHYRNVDIEYQHEMPRQYHAYQQPLRLQQFQPQQPPPQPQHYEPQNIMNDRVIPINPMAPQSIDSNNGIPVVRPLFIDYQNNPNWQYQPPNVQPPQNLPHQPHYSQQQQQYYQQPQQRSEEQQQQASRYHQHSYNAPQGLQQRERNEEQQQSAVINNNQGPTPAVSNYANNHHRASVRR